MGRGRRGGPHRESVGLAAAGADPAALRQVQLGQAGVRQAQRVDCPLALAAHQLGPCRRPPGNEGTACAKPAVLGRREFVHVHKSGKDDPQQRALWAGDTAAMLRSALTVQEVVPGGSMSAHFGADAVLLYSPQYTACAREGIELCPTFFQALRADGAEGAVRQLLHVQKPGDLRRRVVQGALELEVDGLYHLRPALDDPVLNRGPGLLALVHGLPRDSTHPAAAQHSAARAAVSMVQGEWGKPHFCRVRPQTCRSAMWRGVRAPSLRSGSRAHIRLRSP